MTAQFGERLFYDGKCCSMCDTPLGLYFHLSGSRPNFYSESTACWRGYVGTWEIIDNRLYLTDIDATLEDGTVVTLASIFPDYPNRVFAHWYSGDIRIPQGKLLEYVHAGYASRYERDLFLYISKGVITSTEIKINGQSNSTTTSEGYGVGAFLSFGSNNKNKEMQE